MISVLTAYNRPITGAVAFYGQCELFYSGSNPEFWQWEVQLLRVVDHSDLQYMCLFDRTLPYTPDPDWWQDKGNSGPICKEDTYRIMTGKLKVGSGPPDPHESAFATPTILLTCLNIIIETNKKWGLSKTLLFFQ